MPGLTIHRLSDPFALPAQLAAALRPAAASLDPLAVVQVVLPGAGWRGWLMRQLADLDGVVAGVELLDLAGFRRQLPSAATTSLGRVLAIHQALAGAALADRDLTDWLRRDPDGGWRMALAGRLAQGLAEDAVQRPLLGLDTGTAAPPWWRALQAALPPTESPLPLDEDAGPAWLHWVSSTPLLAHDWAVLSGLARTRPVTVWLLMPAPVDPPAPLWQQLGAASWQLPDPLVAAVAPTPLPLQPPGGRLALLREALDRGRAVPALPFGAVAVGAAAGLYEQLRLAEVWLRERFAADPGLSPAEVLLLSPAWPTAIPVIDAVFGAAGSVWPYRVASRRPPPPTRLLYQSLLDSPAQRWTAAELLALLRHPALRAGLGLDADAALRLQAGLARLPGGWGLDAAHRRDWQAGSDPAHSWESLWPLLAEQLDAADPLCRALPRLLDALRTYRAASAGTLRLSAQLAALHQLLEALLPPARRHPAADAAWRAWQQLALEAASVADDPALTQAAFARLISGLLPTLRVDDSVEMPDTAAPEAGLRFAPLQAGAIRPARLIVLFGLEALSFPRRPATGPLEDWRATLDALHPALAPPSAAAIDRQLVLESLWMAADATLWLYADRDVGSGQPLPAPLPIEAALALLPVVQQRSPLPSRRSADPPSPTLLPAAEPPEVLSLGELCACFREPARFQLSRVRGARLPFEALAVDGPLSLTPTLAWQLRTRLLHGLDRSGVPVLPEAPGAAECAALPPGAAGLAVWQTLCSETLALWQYHQNLRLGEPQCININLDIDAPPIRLSGQVLIHAGQLIERVAAVPQARHLVHAWVRALALAAMEVDAQDLVLLGLGQDGPRHVVLRLPPAATAQLHIAELLAAAAGAWSRPLAFTPELALALLEGGERDAHWRWIGSERAPGESQQPVNRWLWAGADPTAPENLPELRWLGERLLPAGLRRAWRRQWPP